MKRMHKKKFRARSGQMDYSHARWVPVINCVVKFGRKVLVVKRSKKLRLYPDYWNGVSGFLDDKKSLREKVYEELREELSLIKKNVRKVVLGEIFDQEAPEYGKTWVVHPVLVEAKTDAIKLDWEADEYRWVTIAEAKKLRLLPGFKQVLENISFAHKGSL